MTQPQGLPPNKASRENTPRAAEVMAKSLLLLFGTQLGDVCYAAAED